MKILLQLCSLIREENTFLTIFNCPLPQRVDILEATKKSEINIFLLEKGKMTFIDFLIIFN